MARSSSNTAEPTSCSSSPLIFTPYKDNDNDDIDVPLLQPPSSSKSDVENGIAYEVRPIPSPTGWRRFIMALRQRSGKGKQVENSTEPVASSKRSKRSCKSIWLKRICLGIPALALMFLGLLHVLEVVLGFGSAIFEFELDDFLPEFGRPGHLGDGLAEYPTDFTRDVHPIPCHSHNDYWRRVPLYQALHFGCTGVEADVWLFDEELFVGHNTASLTKNRTFRSLYVDPLVEILEHQNPNNDFSKNTHHGVFDEDSEQTLVLLVDFKNNGANIYPYVYDQLEPLRARGYLAYWDGKEKHNGPITVVATGNAPFDVVTANTTYRDIFFDAPLADFYETPQNRPDPLQRRGQGHNGIPDDAEFDLSNSYYASVSLSSAIGLIWFGHLSSHQMNLIRGQIQGAQRRGLKVRYWDTPTWPVGYRNHIWDVLVREGADYLNVDDLRGAAHRDWTA